MPKPATTPQLRQQPNFYSEAVKESFKKEGIKEERIDKAVLKNITNIVEKVGATLVHNATTNNKRFSEDDGSLTSFSFTTKRRFEERVQLTDSLLQRIFKASCLEHVLSFLVNWHSDKVLPLIRKVYGNKLDKILITANQALNLHFSIGHSYSMLYKVGAGVNKITKGAVQMDSANSIREFRDSLPTWKIDVFENPDGSKIGRGSNMSSIFDLVLDNPDIISSLNYLFDDQSSAHIIASIHNDGAQQTSFSTFVCFLMRILSLDEVASNPGSVFILGIDEASESSAQFKKFWEEFVMPCLKKIKEKGLRVRCVDDCILCKNNVPFAQPTHEPGEKSTTAETAPEELLRYHIVFLLLCYCMDIKAFKLMLPIGTANCIWCHTNLRVKEHSFKNANPASVKKRTLEKFKTTHEHLSSLQNQYEEGNI